MRIKYLEPRDTSCSPEHDEMGSPVSPGGWSLEENAGNCGHSLSLQNFCCWTRTFPTLKIFGEGNCFCIQEKKSLISKGHLQRAPWRGPCVRPSTVFPGMEERLKAQDCPPGPQSLPAPDRPAPCGHHCHCSYHPGSASLLLSLHRSPQSSPRTRTAWS